MDSSVAQHVSHMMLSYAPACLQTQAMPEAAGQPCYRTSAKQDTFHSKRLHKPRAPCRQVPTQACAPEQAPAMHDESPHPWVTEAPLPPLRTLTAAEPSGKLRWQLLDLLYCYALTARLYNGDHQAIAEVRRKMSHTLGAQLLCQEKHLPSRHQTIVSNRIAKFGC